MRKLLQKLPVWTLLGAATLLAAAILLIWLVVTRSLGRERWDDTWYRIQRDQVMRVCLDATFPPYEYIEADGTYAGLDIELTYALAERWGVQVQFVQVHFDGLYSALEAGKCDMIISALPYDQTRTRDNAYSSAYLYLGQALLVNRTNEDIEGWRDLGTRSVAVELGSEAHQLVRQLARDTGQNIQIIAEREVSGALDVLLRGDADALVVDRTTAVAYLRQYTGLRQVGELGNQVPLVIAADIESGYTISQVNEALGSFHRDRLLERLEQRWF